ncbi:MAG: lysine--tRNA ligase [Candidatus Bilamarchaeaceae archaeon]
MALHKHWAEQIAEKAEQRPKEKYIITSGMTTSGPAHLGTLCEFLFPSTIRKALEKDGKKADYYFIADILDAFDGIPSNMQKYEKELTPHLGKPLCDVPDPTGKTKSFGDHFLDETKEIMKRFDIDAKHEKANELYASGRMDEYARFFLKNEAQAKKIIEDVSGKEQKKEWSPIMPICANCGKIATTRVLSHDGEEYEYVCDKDVEYTKGCGFRGKARISDHRYKLQWRLHWPAWMKVYKTDIEGAGMDHHTKGGSWDSTVAVFNEMFKEEPPVGYKFGFILFKGKKYSKSKGIGMGVTELMEILPPELLKYMLLKPDLEENTDIDPEPKKLMSLIEDFQEHAKLVGRDVDSMDRSERKKVMAIALSTKKVHWKVPFLDALLYYEIYGDWERVKKESGDPEGVEYLKPYILKWIEKKFVPEEYMFQYSPRKAEGAVKEFIEGLNPEMDALAIHNAVFDFAKGRGIEPKEMFRLVYLTLIGKERGPRVGKLVHIVGVGKVKKDTL